MASLVILILKFAFTELILIIFKKCTKCMYIEIIMFDIIFGVIQNMFCLSKISLIRVKLVKFEAHGGMVIALVVIGI